MNRLTDFEDSQGNATSLDYDAEGRLSSLTCPNGAVTSADYDIVGKLLGLRTVKGSSELLSLRYGYNLSSDRLALQTEKGSYTYHLDRGGRLIQETAAPAQATGSGSGSTPGGSLRAQLPRSSLSLKLIYIIGTASSGDHDGEKKRRMATC